MQQETAIDSYNAMHSPDVNTNTENRHERAMRAAAKKLRKKLQAFELFI